MYRIPVTFLDIVHQGSGGFIVAIDLDDLTLKEVKQVIFYNQDSSEIVENEISLTELTLLANAVNSTKNAYSVTDSQLFMFFNNSNYSYDEDTKFSVIGYRNIVPITSENDFIDVPEEYLELFVKYALMELYRVQGKRVPVDLFNEIKKLENKLEIEK